MRPCFLRIVLTLALTALTNSPLALFAQVAPIDTSFNAGLITPALVRDVAIQTNGQLIIVGGFDLVSGFGKHGYARLNADGSLDASFNTSSGPEGPFSDGTVTKARLQADGKVVVAGFFNILNGYQRSRFARINSDGSMDDSFVTGGFDSWVWDIVIQTDGKILVAGGFTSVGGIPRGRIARFNIDGNLDASFTPTVGGSVGDAVTALAVQGDGNIIISGIFKTVNTVARTNVARINPQGILDTSFNSGTGFGSGWCYDRALQSDGKVLISGDFSVLAESRATESFA